jgi:hypothetical protein
MAGSAAGGLCDNRRIVMTRPLVLTVAFGSLELGGGVAWAAVTLRAGRR